jgi:hypothetical protein
MRRKASYVAAMGVTILLMAMVLLVGGMQLPIRATYDPSRAGPELLAALAPELTVSSLDAVPGELLSPMEAMTVTLPLILRNYPPPASPFGVIMYGAVNDAAGLPAVRDAGIRWVTTRLDWADIEPSKGTYNWDGFDAKAQNASLAGMDVFVLFTDNPTWAAELPGGPVNDPQDLVDFVTLVAERYDCDGTDDAVGHPCVHYWSFYAEPDNGDLNRALIGKGYWGHNGVGYAEMLSQVSPAIRGADPKARVFTGGLAYDSFEEDGGPFVRSFLPDTLDALEALGGADQYLDGVAFHYYPISYATWPTIRQKTEEIQGVMTSHGAGDLPTICPEMGCWSSPKFGSTEQWQAQWLVTEIARGISVDLEFLSWYKVFDTAVAEGPDDLYPDQTSGLLRVDGSPKPSYYAYQTMIREFKRYSYLRPYLDTPGVEGSIFGYKGHEKTVLWSWTGTANVTFPYTALRRVEMLGAASQVLDNQAGDLDTVVGQITIAVGENLPVYVESQ